MLNAAPAVKHSHNAESGDTLTDDRPTFKYNLTPTTRAQSVVTAEQGSLVLSQFSQTCASTYNSVSTGHNTDKLQRLPTATVEAVWFVGYLSQRKSRSFDPAMGEQTGIKGPGRGARKEWRLKGGRTGGPLSLCVHLTCREVTWFGRCPCQCLWDSD
ncbi:hypothetical protein BaRGS_00007630 [Batillaria attramentaria]|uniref:Uncharacterized protein n=1 Tax=Batillaria attramentaria TaxID=370345 RepID=A0ABD0LNX3_9CAEN